MTVPDSPEARYARMYTFYWEHRCRMVRVHLLSSTALVLAGFAHHSPTFERVAQATCPVDVQGKPRTPLWQTYADACDAKLPRDVLEERWIEAHLADIRAVREQNLLEALAAENHPEPLASHLREHAAITLGTRHADLAAAEGSIPVQTAVAVATRGALFRLLQSGRPLIRHYLAAGLRALLWGGPTLPGGFSPRRTSIEGLWFAMSSWTAFRIYRKGLRTRDRGVPAETGSWSLVPALTEVFGERVAELHPDVVRLFADIDAFDITASVELHTGYARVAARMGTLFVGQGMYEESLADVRARFRIFQRSDGTHHFLREFYAGDKVRVFDSDFTVRSWDGTPTFFELFVDIDTAARMNTSITPEGGLVMQVEEVLFRGMRLQPAPFRVRFVTEAVDGCVEVVGTLEMRPETWLQRFVFKTLLRRPTQLGRISYTCVPKGLAE